jgi:hypothetical protein
MASHCGMPVALPNGVAALLRHPSTKEQPMKTRFLLAGALALSACGGSTTGVSPTAVTEYQRAALSASSAVTTYASSTQTMITPADCQAAAQQYAAQMGAAVQGMRQTSSSMDDHMRSMGQSGAADMTCGAEVMATQLQQHLGVACSSADMNQNRAVAAQHCQQMAVDADHLQMRAAGMGAMMGAGGTMGAGMMGSGDMSSAMQNMMDSGFTAPDGQHMGWNETLPGCTLNGGTYQPTSGADGGAPTTPAG